MGRAPCCDKANVKKGPWSPEEDARLKSYIEESGTGGNWIALPQKIGLKRCGKSCRLRWLNYLRPNLKHGGFSEEEDRIICSLYVSIGSRWSIIAAQLPGRTDNDIKNYWNTRLKKKLLGKQRKDHHSNRKSKRLLLNHQNPNQFGNPNFLENPNSAFEIAGSQVLLPNWPPTPPQFQSPATITTTNPANPHHMYFHHENQLVNLHRPPTDDDHKQIDDHLMSMLSSGYDLGGCFGQEMAEVGSSNAGFPRELEELMTSNPTTQWDEMMMINEVNMISNGDSRSWGEMSSLISLPLMEAPKFSSCDGIPRQEDFAELRYSNQ